jgi:hypothetical protein
MVDQQEVVAADGQRQIGFEPRDDFLDRRSRLQAGTGRGEFEGYFALLGACRNEL